jgi:hypothetical protein
MTFGFRTPRAGSLSPAASRRFEAIAVTRDLWSDLQVRWMLAAGDRLPARGVRNPNVIVEPSASAGQQAPLGVGEGSIRASAS